MSSTKLKKLPLCIIVPITDWKAKYEIAPWMVKLIPNQQNGLSKNSTADCFQVRSVSQQRFIKKIGRLTSNSMDEIMKSLSLVLEIPLI